MKKKSQPKPKSKAPRLRDDEELCPTCCKPVPRSAIRCPHKGCGAMYQQEDDDFSELGGPKPRSRRCKDAFDVCPRCLKPVPQDATRCPHKDCLASYLPDEAEPRLTHATNVPPEVVAAFLRLGIDGGPDGEEVAEWFADVVPLFECLVEQREGGK